VGSETAWIKGEEPPLSVPPAPALKKVAVVNPRRRRFPTMNSTICWIMAPADEQQPVLAGS
jgi:hypothetical protein